MLLYSYVAGVTITRGVLAALGIEPSAVGLCVQGPNRVRRVCLSHLLFCFAKTKVGEMFGGFGCKMLKNGELM